MSKELEKLLVTYAYDTRQKAQLRLADEKGLDITKMKDPRYNWEQMREISLAMDYGLNPNTLCDPDINAESMERIRYSLMDQQSVFDDAKEEIKKKRAKRISLIIFTIIFGFIVAIIYLMNKDTIKKYIEPVPLELTTDKITVEYGNNINFMDYVKYYDKSQQLTIPLNQKLNKVKDYKFIYSVTNGVKTKESTLIVSVVDKTKPIIELIQNQSTINKGDAFKPEIYIKSVKDNYDHLLVDDVKIDNPVDTNKTGNYKVVYQVHDEHGNVAVSELKVSVIDPLPKDRVNQIIEKNHETKPIKKRSNESNTNIETQHSMSTQSKIFYIRDYGYDLFKCSNAANDYLNQSLSNSNVSLSGYIEPYQEDGKTVGYKVLFR